MDAEKVRRVAGSRRHALTHAPTGALEPILSDEVAFLDEAAAALDVSLDSFHPPPTVE